MEKGQTEPFVIPMDELVREDRAKLQTKIIVQMIKEANELGLAGKRVTELVSVPSFQVHDLQLVLKWESAK